MPLTLAAAVVATGMVALPAQYPAGSPHSDLLDSIAAFRGSFRETAIPRGPAALALLDERRLDALLRQAEQQHKAGKGDAASATLQEAYMLTEQALIRLRDSETVVYERKFRTPADEYRYERELYRSYESLVAKAIGEAGKAAPPDVQAMAAEARALDEQATGAAQRGDYALAIRKSEGASAAMQRALERLGVMAAQ